MTTGSLPARTTVRHTAHRLPVTGSMASLRSAMPFIRAAILAGVVTMLIMVGLPAVLAIASAASL